MRNRSRDVVQWHPMSKEDFDRLKDRYEYYETFGSYANDWNMGAGARHIFASVGSGYVSMLLLHTYTNNNPVGYDPMYGEGLIFEFDTTELVKLRDLFDLMSEESMA